MNWLEQLIERLLSVFPRIALIGPDERGLRETFGKYWRVLQPGWYMYWPLIQETFIRIITPQVVDLKNQSVTTKDGVSIAVSGAIEYEVRDVAKTYLNVHDVDKSLPVLALGLIAHYISRKDYDECRNSDDIKDGIRKDLRDHCNDWGLKINHIFITDFSKHIVYRIMGDTNQVLITGE